MTNEQAYSSRTAIASQQSVTYRFDHASEHQLSQLIERLQEALDELRQMSAAYSDATTARSRNPRSAPDETGRSATRGPSRPTEDIALDDARQALHDELKIGARYLPAAIAYVLGVTASMDRALSRWEGEGALHVPRGLE
ncbi:hypothetical protein AB0N28_03550 [Streptomyces sp. NPDC051130]|uniref:DUF7169 domain-containing protein n=1 Tax=Streptomyces sp. NPDC051130 TaxID=3157223 RepID=UPI0034447CC5